MDKIQIQVKAILCILDVETVGMSWTQTEVA